MPTMWRIVELSAPVALVASLLLLWLYLRAVRRSAQRTAGSTSGLNDSPKDEPRTSAAPLAPLEVRPAADPPTVAIRAAWRRPLLAVAVQIAAGLAYAVTLTVAWSTAIEGSIGWQGYAMGTLTAIWPMVIVVGLVATVSWRTMALLALAYIFVLAGAVALMQQNGQPGWDVVVRSWWQGPGLATLVTIAFLARPIRAMGLLILVMTMAGWAGVFAINEVLQKTNAIERVVGMLPEISSTASVHLATAVLAFVFWGVPAIIATAACYLVLRGVGRLYRARWFSDQQLQIDAIWLIFTLAYGWSLLPLGGLLAFIAYKLVSWTGLRLIAHHRPLEHDAPRLLLLRVFSLGARSSRLFEGFARQWRYQGNVRMIAGPDLTNTTVEPHEFLDFLAGRLDRSFIDGSAKLEQRLAEAEPRRDPDGRYRVASFFCHDDTWRMVLRRLARESDAVMMDLRGFTSQHEGCVFELGVLLDTMPLSRVVLVVDETTDAPFLQEVLRKSWENISAASPNRNDPAPRVHLFTLDRTSERNIARLVASVATAARSGEDAMASA